MCGVGGGSPGGWSEPRGFDGAGAPRPFAFIYMGDAQNGLDTWGRLVRVPDASGRCVILPDGGRPGEPRQ
jgi:hypothetical protein